MSKKVKVANRGPSPVEITGRLVLPARSTVSVVLTPAQRAAVVAHRRLEIEAATGSPAASAEVPDGGPDHS